MGRTRRKPKGKKINPTFFVFCEGKTEVAYVHFLKKKYRVSSIQIHAAEKGNNISKNYIENYKQDKFTAENDLDFLMYDLDAPKMLERLSAIPNAILLVSNPCIELWFILHYKNQVTAIDSKSCFREVKTQCNSYEKGTISSELFNALTNLEAEAIAKAKQQEAFKNPSSTIYLLLEKLQDFNL
ncbi:MAG: RloB domain-containing protein [Bacteroidetes bacterium]|nr:MAG: RloB domain-containing protein [Bacteroidota bacterium]MBL1144945.1 RloB domain-containing protein [Bacteroidota bacterium]NOG57739.1 RloB domain-containing protein [Bacteroidota bacterium]